MKKMNKFTSFILSLLLLCGCMMPPVHAQRMQDGNAVGGNADWTSDALSLISRNWDDSYFSRIVLTNGEPFIRIDGEEIEATAPMIQGEDVFLPIEEIAELLDEPLDDEILSEELSMMAVMEAAPDTETEDIHTEMESELELVPVMRADLDVVCEELNLEAIVSDDKVILTRPYQTRQIIVKVQEGNTLGDLHGATDYAWDGQDTYLLQYATEEEAIAAQSYFMSLDEVSLAAPNKVVGLNTQIEEDGEDIESTAQSALAERWGSERVAADVYKQYLAGKEGEIDVEKDIVVAVLDTGVESTHPFLKDRLYPGVDYSSDFEYDYPGHNVNPEDLQGHGTHVTGTIVDCTPDNIKILPVKVLNDAGFATDLNVVLGVKYASGYADVVNMSLGGECSSYGGSDCFICSSIPEIVAEKDLVVVAAAGNEASDVDTFCPARLDCVISVAATDKDETRASFSNYGNAVDIAAPGVAILSSHLNGSYAYFNGTSQAAPHVTAGAAMIKMKKPDATPEEVKAELKQATVDIGEAGDDIQFGAGRLDMRMITDAKPDIEMTNWGLNYTEDMTITLAQPTYKYPLYVSQALPEDATNKAVSFESSDEGIAYYEGGYLITCGIGETTIKATSSNGVQHQFIVTVEESDNWIDFAAEDYAGGTGQKSDPYQIATAEQLAKLSADVLFKVNQYMDTYFQITADIDLSGKEWTPIGVPIVVDEETYAHYFFAGTLDGGDHTISGMQVKEATDADTIEEVAQSSRIGLFRGLIKGQVHNLVVRDADVTGFRDVGILCGAIVNYGEEKSIVDHVAVSGYSSEAALVAFVKYSEVKNAYSFAKSADGLISSGIYSSFQNCFNAGEVTDENFGGGFAYWLDNSKISNCFAATMPISGQGFARHSTDSDYEGCYYLDGSAGPFGTGEDVSVSGNSGIPIAKPANFFTAKGNYTNMQNWADAGWNFSDEWSISPYMQEGYPYLTKLASAWGEAVYIQTTATAGGTVTESFHAPKNTSVKLTATPGNGYQFTGWFVDGKLLSSAASYSGAFSQNTAVEGRFAQTAISPTPTPEPVIPAVTKVKFPVKTVYITKGSSLKVPAVATTRSGAKAPVTYRSSAKKVANVSSAGKIKAVKTGDATITAKAENGKKGTLHVKVVSKSKAKQIKSVTISGAPKTLKVGKSKQLKAKLNPSKASNVIPKWSSSNKKALSVDNTGRITAHKKGKVKITVKVGSKKARVTIHVK